MNLEKFHEAAESSALLFKQILVKWAHALRLMNDEKSPMFLPFAPDDQDIGCLMASWDGYKIEFTSVQVKEDGHAFDWDDIEGFIISPHEIYPKPYEPVGEYEKEEVVAALLSAHILDTDSEERV